MAIRTFHVTESSGSAERIASMAQDNMGTEDDFDSSVLEEDEVMSRYRVTITVTEIEPKTLR